MTSLLQRFLEIPTPIVQTVGYFIVFIAQIAESIPPFWFITPWQTLVLVAGILAQMEVFSLPIILGLIGIGGQIGDTIAYFIGHKYGLNFLKKFEKHFKISDELLEKVKHILEKNLLRSILLSKFYGRTRGILPFVAGISNINKKKVLGLSCISNILRSCCRIAAGYFIGTSYDIVEAKIGKFLAIGATTIIGVIIVFVLFKRYQTTVKKSFLALVIGNIWWILAFSFLAQKIHANKFSFASLDLRVNSFFGRHPVIENLTLQFNQIFDFRSIGLIGLIIIVYLYRKKLIYQLTVFISTMLSGLIIFPLIKMLIQKPRPLEALIPLSDFSFPSGHTTIGCIICLLIRYVCHDQIKSKRKQIWFLFLVIIGILVIGWSRMILHVHRFTDIIGGLLLGFCIIATNIILRKFIFNKHLENRNIIINHSRKQLIDILT